MWAPAVLLGNEYTSQETLNIVSTSVLWRRGGSTITSYDIDREEDKLVKSAFFTQFQGSPKVALVFTATRLHCFDLHGNSYAFALKPVPQYSIPSAKGAILTCDSKHFLMEDPHSPMGLIEAGTTTLILQNEIPVFGATDKVPLCVFHAPKYKWLKIYAISHMDPSLEALSVFGPLRTHSQRQKRQVSNTRQRRPENILAKLNESTAMENLSMVDSFVEPPCKRKAVLNLTHTVVLTGENAPETVLCQHFDDMAALVMLEKSSNTVHELLFHNAQTPQLISETKRPARQVVCLEGFVCRSVTYPLLLYLTTDGRLELSSCFHELRPLCVPVDKSIGTIEGVESVGGNKVSIRDSRNQSHGVHIFLEYSGHDLVTRCFEILSNIVEAENMVALQFIYTANVFEQGGNDFSSLWQAFHDTIISVLATQHNVESWKLSASRYPASCLEAFATDIIRNLHLLREEYILVPNSVKELRVLGELLAQLTSAAGWVRWPAYYNVENLQPAEFATNAVPVSVTPPNVIEFLESLLTGASVQFVSVDRAEHLFPRIATVKTILSKASDPSTPMSKLLLCALALGLTPDKLANFEVFERVVLSDIVQYLGKCEVYGHDADEFDVSQRMDLYFLALLDTKGANFPPWLQETVPQLEITRLMFNDLRFSEAKRLLSTESPTHSRLVRLNDLADHDWQELQQIMAETIAMRKFAASFGVAALEYSNLVPVCIDQLHPARLDLDLALEGGVVFNTNVELICEGVRMRGHFHRGVATGLRVSRDTVLSSTWIVSNKPEEGSEEDNLVHAGLLLGLGLNGHLKKFESWYIYKYLDRNQEATRAALILGLAASQVGSADSKLTGTLSLHIRSLLPTGSNDLNVTPDVENVSILATGLVHCETQSTTITKAFLDEMFSKECPERLGSTTVMLGMAIGLVNLNFGEQDSTVTIEHEIVKRLVVSADEFSSSSSESIPNIAATYGSTVALMLMYMCTNRQDIARRLAPPRRSFGRTWGKPQVLYLRSLAYNLILFDDICASHEWVEAQMEPFGFDLACIQQASPEHVGCLYSLVGVLVAMCLKFCASDNAGALDVVLHYMDVLRNASIRSEPLNAEAQIMVTNLCYLQGLLCSAAALIVCGKGNVALLQRLRLLHGQLYPNRSTTPVRNRNALDDLFEHAVFNMYCGVSHGLGLLFLGGGTFSLECSRRGLGFLALSLVPVLDSGHKEMTPSFVRHLWALAPRDSCVKVLDVADGRVLRVPLELRFKDGHTVCASSPHLVSRFEEIQEIRLVDPLYKKVCLDLASDTSIVRGFLKRKTIFAQRETASESTSLDKSSVEWRALDTKVRSEDLRGLRFLTAYATLRDCGLLHLGQTEVERIYSTLKARSLGLAIAGVERIS